MTSLTLPEDTYWIIVFKGDNLYALDAPGTSYDDDDNKLGDKIRRLMDDRPLSDILEFVGWIGDDCPAEEDDKGGFKPTMRKLQ